MRKGNTFRNCKQDGSPQLSVECQRISTKHEQSTGCSFQDYTQLLILAFSEKHIPENKQNIFKRSLFLAYVWEDNSLEKGRYSVATIGNDGSYSKEYFDILGRSVRKTGKSFNSSKVYSDTRYRADGKLDWVSVPYFSGTPNRTTPQLSVECQRISTKHEQSTGCSFQDYTQLLILAF